MNQARRVCGERMDGTERKRAEMWLGEREKMPRNDPPGGGMLALSSLMPYAGLVEGLASGFSISTFVDPKANGHVASAGAAAPRLPI